MVAVVVVVVMDHCGIESHHYCGDNGGNGEGGNGHGGDVDIAVIVHEAIMSFR